MIQIITPRDPRIEDMPSWNIQGAIIYTWSAGNVATGIFVWFINAQGYGEITFKS